MAEVSRQYMSEVAGQLGYLVTWLPGRTVQLGQTGPFDGIQLEPEGRLDEDGIVFSASHDKSATSLEYRTAKAVTVGLSAGASTATGERAEIEISFSRENAVVLDVHGAVEHRIANIGDVKQRILELARRSGWDPRKAVIVSVVRAERATVMISSARGASVRCNARAGEALANLADPRLDLRQTAEKSMHTTIVSRGELTPLYQALILRRGLRGLRLERALRGAETIDASDPLRQAIDEHFVLCVASVEDDGGTPPQ